MTVGMGVGRKKPGAPGTFRKRNVISHLQMVTLNQQKEIRTSFDIQNNY